MPQKNSLYTVDITDINNFGNGVCRVENIVTFVVGAVTGDRAVIRIIKVTKNYLVARIEKLISPSVYRIETDCKIFKQCGGCIYRNIKYEYEKKLKRDYIVNAFRKSGIFADVLPVISNGLISQYRNKVQYPVSPEGKTGYYKTKTHDIIECEDCFLECKETEKISKFLKNRISEKPNPSIRHIYLRAAVATGEVMLCFVCRDAKDKNMRSLAYEAAERFKELKSVVCNVNDKDTNVILGNKTEILFGRGYIIDELLGLKFMISPTSFYQVNHDMAELLYKKVIELADLKTGEKFIDLYCGCGTIGLCVAKNCPDSSLIGVEIVESAVENARRNAEMNGVENADFICADATDTEIPGLNDASLVIVDPPRKGLSNELIDKIADAGTERIVYVSCNPDTLARDATYFMEKGYTMSQVHPFDLFPRTGHVENVVRFFRNN